MRNTVIIAYDVTDDKRRSRAHRILKGFGEALQYSVFRCDISAAEEVVLQTKLWEVLNLQEDRLVLLNLGPKATSNLNIKTWGKPLEEALPASCGAIIL